MIRLALCDDEAEQRALTEKLVREYLARQGMPAARLSVFSSGGDLLLAAEEDGFDIYILDIMMPEMSGVEVGKRLRVLGQSGIIIYLSVSPEYALDSYQAQAFYYLLKPADPEKLYAVLDGALAALEKQKTSCVTVKTKDGLRLLRLDNILYVELSHRSIHYYLSGGERVDSITVRRPFQQEMMPLLADPRFFLCGVSFVVNLYYVTAVEKGFLWMDGGVRVPLSRAAAPKARQRWSDYWLNGAEEEKL